MTSGLEMDDGYFTAPWPA